MKGCVNSFLMYFLEFTCEAILREVSLSTNSTSLVVKGLFTVVFAVFSSLCVCWICPFHLGI